MADMLNRKKWVASVGSMSINEDSLILDINDKNVLFINAIEVHIFLGLELKLLESIAAIRMKESTDPYIVQELTNLLVEKSKLS